MPIYTKKKTLLYSQKQMYGLVADVKAYPDFLPWCKALTVVSCAGDTMRANMCVKLASYEVNFPSVVRFSPWDCIEIRNDEQGTGPLKLLHSSWRFQESAEGMCAVDFFIEVSLRNALLNPFLAAAMETAGAEMVEAFELRAESCYGKDHLNSTNQSTSEKESGSSNVGVTANDQDPKNAVSDTLKMGVSERCEKTSS